MKTLKAATILLLIMSLIITSCSKEGAVGPMGPAGPQGAQGLQGPQGEQGLPGADGADGTDGADGVDGEDGPSRFSIYSQSSTLSNGTTNATSTLQSVGPVFNITKEFDDSRIEIFFNSNCSSGIWESGIVRGVKFQVRINGTDGNYGNEAVIKSTNTEQFISIYDVFLGLKKGKHQVQIYTQISGNGVANNVQIDPGNWGGRIIAKETF